MDDRWELWHCRSEVCGAGPWKVQQWPGTIARWWVARPGQAVPWTEAGTLPFCPLCASDLAPGTQSQGEPSPAT